MVQMNTNAAGEGVSVTVRDIRTAPSATPSAPWARTESRALGPSSISWRAPRDVGDAGEGDGSRFECMLRRLRERKVVQWTAAYVAMAWIVLQSAELLAGIWGWSVRFQQVVSLLLGLGVFPALVVAWFHGEKGKQDVCRLEAALIAACLMGATVAIWSFCLASTAGVR